MIKLGEVKIPEDKDFEYIKSFALDATDWQLEYEKNQVVVWTKRNELSSFNILKLKAEFSDVSASLLYDVLHDAEYRPQWDDRMVEGYEICSVSLNSDIGYYAVKSPKPFKNRDFCTQRCWLDYGENREKIIFNHSVNHSKCPVKKNYIRAMSYLTGLYIIPTGKTSCTLYYLTQSDPGGSLPVWIVNMTSKVFAPKLMKKLHKASLKYDKWKSKQKNANFKPWLFPEQMTSIERIDWKDITNIDMTQMKAQNLVDESQISENDVDKTEANDNDE